MFVLEDVRDAELHEVRAQKIGKAPTFVLRNVDELRLVHSRPVGGDVRRRAMTTVLGIGALVGAAACRAARHPGTSPPPAAWVGTWATAQQLVEPANLPPAPGLSGNTLRQVVQASLGGHHVRVRLSNVFGDAPLVVDAAHVASSIGGSRIDLATDRRLTFAGVPKVAIPAGGEAVSDAVPFALRALSSVAVTLRFGVAPTAITGHPGSRTTSYLQAGDAVGAESLPAAVKTQHWYVTAGIDVARERTRAAVVVLGNSITDGRGSGTDRQNRWPDELARRLQRSGATADIAVLNAGIGGNCVLRACVGPSALDRFDRDVLQDGVRWLIVLEGVNDIGGARDSSRAEQVARELIAAYQRIIARAHARRIVAIGATILPFGRSFYDTAAHEAARSTVNRWIRTSGAFDAVVDMDSVMRDASDPTRLAARADGGDHLHPNEAGYRMMADAVDLAIFARRR